MSGTAAVVTVCRSHFGRLLLLVLALAAVSEGRGRSSAKPFDVTTIPARSGNATGCLVFLHGSGQSGTEVAEKIQKLRREDAQFPHIKILLPTSPEIRLTAAGGRRVHTWFDVSNFTEDAVENYSQLDESGQFITKLITSQISEGIPPERIAIAGFSRGGAMSFHMGYYYFPKVAGVVVMSSWIPKTSRLYEHVKKSDVGKLPPLFQEHGALDLLVPRYLAEGTASTFSSLGVRANFQLYTFGSHRISRRGLGDLYSYITNLIPNN